MRTRRLLYDRLDPDLFSKFFVPPLSPSLRTVLTLFYRINLFSSSVTVRPPFFPLLKALDPVKNFYPLAVTLAFCPITWANCFVLSFRHLPPRHGTSRQVTVFPCPLYCIPLLPPVSCFLHPYVFEVQPVTYRCDLPNSPVRKAAPVLFVTLPFLTTLSSVVLR